MAIAVLGDMLRMVVSATATPASVDWTLRESLTLIVAFGLFGCAVVYGLVSMVDSCATGGTCRRGDAAIGRTERGDLAVYVSSCGGTVDSIRLFAYRGSQNPETVWSIERTGEDSSRAPFVLGAERDGYRTDVSLVRWPVGDGEIEVDVSDAPYPALLMTASLDLAPGMVSNPGGPDLPIADWDRDTQACRLERELPYALFVVFGLGGTGLVALGSIPFAQRRRTRIARSSLATPVDSD